MSNQTKKQQTKKQKIILTNEAIQMNNNKMIGRVILERPGYSLIDEYFDLQIEFEKKYGPKTIVLMQVGGFFECYGVNNKEEKIGNLNYVAELLNIQLSRRNKAIIENSRSNALMMGFPLASIKRFLNVLLNDFYTIVLIEQTTEPPNVKREITAIHSAGTYIEDVQNSDPNYIVSIYINEDTCHRTGSSLYSLGLSSVDLSTGNCTVYEKNNHLNDKKAIFEDMYRFIESFNPKEIIFHNGEMRRINKQEILNSLNTQNRLIHFERNKIEENIIKIKNQNDFLAKIYPDSGVLTPIEYINLERSPNALISFILLLNFAYEHNENILKKIKKPELWEYQEHLILYHNTIYQLNIISNQQQIDNSSKYKSLYDVLQKTSTSMGRRLLKYRIMNPVTSIKELERRYNQIEKIRELESECLENIEKHLNEIIDMERMHRKMELGVIHPYEFGGLNISYERVKDLIIYLTHIEGFEWSDFGINMENTNNIFERFDEYRKEYGEYFDMEDINRHGLLNILGSFLKKGINAEVDKIQSDIDIIEKYFNDKCKKYSNIIEPGQDDLVKLESNERDGYYLACTKKRADILEKKLDANEKKDMEFKKYQVTNAKITSKEIDENSYKLVALKEKIKGVVKDEYLIIIQKLISKYDNVLKEITQFIAELDVIKSNVKCANLYGYNKPIINDKYNNKSYFSANGMRHPLIEVLHDDVKYIDNDIELLKGENDCNGILLMGLNGVGKSSMAKAIGCNIVMAQCGMFVPCKSFEFYPYHKIFTRINGDDNIFKGMSSFVVEMSELRAILKYSDEHSIVLGDEVCKGTEETSALSIVSASIQRFSEKEVNFIMATHFHKLHQMDEITELKNIRFKHLSVEYDEIEDKIIYGRKLLEGPGDTLYGLEIAQYLINDKDFIQKARVTRNKILNIESSFAKTIVEDRSKYNSDLIVDVCMVCGKNKQMVELHTHHLTEQHEYEGKKENIDGVRKNQLSNLVVLCEKHHMETHQNKLIIEGWKETTRGRELYWKMNENIKDNNNKKEEDNMSEKSLTSEESIISEKTDKSDKSKEDTKSNKSEDELEDDNVLMITQENRKKQKNEEEEWIQYQYDELKQQIYDTKKLAKELNNRIKKKGIKMTVKKINYLMEKFSKE